jgi:hypothetical protein
VGTLLTDYRKIQVAVGDTIVGFRPNYGLSECISKSSLEINRSARASNVRHYKGASSYLSNDMCVDSIAMYNALDPVGLISGILYPRPESICPQEVHRIIKPHSYESATTAVIGIRL